MTDSSSKIPLRGNGRSARAGLTFPVFKVHRNMKKGRYAKTIQHGSSVYFTAVLEYLCCEVVEVSGLVAINFKKKRITPRHLQIGIQNDDELCKLFDKITIAQGGVLPNIHPELTKKSKSKLKKKKNSQDSTVTPLETEESGPA
ncbi:uncharacterized protein L201_000058 [Kwoniella dendrophila CBS 6074]|uniref:Histone H2A n=1 Tax=Kwoniella dendrophila CBS 6074 TaxID=1295534 RepID=A0AAX4JIA3_9TREE